MFETKTIETTFTAPWSPLKYMSKKFGALETYST